MAEQFSLCWDNFHSNMSSSFSELLKSEDLVDVTLAAEGRYLKAHKIVLSVCSPYFQELFHVNPCQHPIVFLKDVSYSALSNLLQFMYQGEVKVSQDELTNFIKVAEALKIKGLTGDGVKETEEKESPIPPNLPDIPEIMVPKETTLSRKSSYGRTSPIRKKMMGPASKRARSDLPEIPPHMIEDVRSVAPEPEQFMNFKVEPEEVASSYDDNNDDFTYDDTNPDVSNMSDSADYLMEAKMDSSMKEVKPGTSTNSDSTADNQVVHFLRRFPVVRKAGRRATRKRCHGCYMNLRKYCDTYEASKRAKAVYMECWVCKKPFCAPCFRLYHEQISNVDYSIDIHR